MALSSLGMPFTTKMLRMPWASVASSVHKMAIPLIVFALSRLRGRPCWTRWRLLNAFRRIVTVKPFAIAQRMGRFCYNTLGERSVAI